MPMQQLVKRKEESMEVGGYFICNDLERIIRMLIQQCCHHVVIFLSNPTPKKMPDRGRPACH